MVLILHGLLFLSAGISLVYGASRFLGRKTALFKGLITLAFGGLMLGRLYEGIVLLLQGEIPPVFHVGMLAVIGGFMFLFSASYGQMDGLVDDRSRGLRKYRLLALLAPLGIAALYVPVWQRSDIAPAAKIITGVLLLALALAAYYNLKHLLIPDVSFGIIRSIRGYNLLALVLACLYAVQLVAERLGNDLLWTGSSVGIIVLCPIVLPVMERGSRKWTL